MTDQTTPQQTPPNTVQASPIKQLRLIRPNERPNDALLEITTGKGVQHFLLPGGSLRELSEKFARFADGEGVQ